MFVDTVKITVQAGSGGHGAISFHREKYVTRGGPDGGDGGKGGDVVLIGATGIQTLMDFRYKKKFLAEDGEKGSKNNRFGRDGKECIIRVPVGTVVLNERGEVVADVNTADTPVVLLKGGHGGYGNARFATPTRRTPSFAKPGGKAEPFEVTLQLKTLADVGLVGLPNAGKSSFLAAATRANPKIAGYPFTTLHPNLGLADVGGFSFLLADIPGLIEGAAGGAGLGFAFLRHVERSRLLVHVVDLAAMDGVAPLDAFNTVMAELEAYDPAVAAKPMVIVGNKIDMPEAEEAWPEFRAAMQARGLPVFECCAALGEGVPAVLGQLAEMLAKLPPPEPVPVTARLSAVEGLPFTIVKQEGVYRVEGPMMERLTGSVNLGDPDSLRYFSRIMQDHGVIDALRKAGCHEGDTVEVLDFVFDFVE